MATPETSFVFDSSQGLITGFIGPETIIDIPLTIGGVLVSGIGYRGFYQKTSITSITATSSVSYIGSGAFGGCTSLTTLNIPGATYIGTSAFGGCTSLTTISLPNAVNLESYAFYGCTSLTTISLPNAVNLGSYAFVGSHFTSLNLPEVATIGTNAFDGCTSLTSISIPKATSIPYKTFYGCTSLTSITIPNSVTSIGTNAFDGCTSLTAITIPDSVTSIGNTAFYNCTSLTAITIPNSVTSIGNTAFYNCPITVTITNPTPPIISTNSFDPSDLVEIEVTFGSFAAYKTAEGWSSFASKIIINSDPTPASAFTFDETTNTITEYIHVYQVGDPDYYKNIIIPEYINVSGTDYPVNNIDIDAFKNNTDITGIYTASTTIMLNNNAFLGCVNLTKAYCENVTTFGLDVFNGCTSLDEVLLSNSLTSINVRTFINCSSLTTINLSNTITSIGDAAFQNCYILALTDLPTSLETIGQYAFTNCRSITIETIPETVTSIGQRAFFNCYSISNIIIPASITSIAQYTFTGCNILETVSLPNTLISIDEHAFDDCGLINVTIPASVYSIGDYAFNCSTLSTVTELSTTPPELGGATVFNSSIDRIYVYYDYLNTYKAANIWSSYSTKIKAISTPQSDFTFDTITNTIISYNHTYTVGDPDYYKNVIIPDAFIQSGAAYPSTNIGENCFEGKTGIEKVIIQDLTTTLGIGSFRECSDLIEIIIPSSVESIGSTSFYGCHNLTDIVLPEGIASIGSNTFNGCSDLPYINIPSSVSSIGYSAFFACNNINNIIIPEGVTTIEDDTFHQCPNLTNITIPPSITSIGAKAFSGCSSLEEIIFPGLVTSIGTEAFYGCSTDITFYSNTPAVIVSDTFKNFTGEIFVFYSNLNTYKQALIWLNYTSIIYPLATPREDFTFDESTKTIISYNHTYVAGDLEYYQQVVIPDTFTVSGTEYPTEIIGEEAFINKNLQKVVIQSPITTLKSAAFRNCSSLIEVVFPNTLTTLEDEVFYDCTSLPEVNLPSSVASLGAYCLYHCDSLTAFTFPPLIATIPSFMFGTCGSLETINFNESITYINEFAFEYCSALETIEIPSTVLDTGIGIFLYCTALSSVILPNSLTSIKSKMFERCSSLLTITIPETIENLGTYVFYNSGLTSITIPSSVYLINNSCFEGSDLTSITIPNTVTTLGADVFKNCTSLTTATIADSISTIPNGTFNGCSVLTNYVISDSITNIGDSAFSGCSSIDELIIPINVSVIGVSALSGTSIVTIELPPSVSTIGHNAFENCTLLTTVTVLKKTHPILDGLIFQGCTSLTKIYVKKNIYLNDYITADYWITYASLFDCLIHETDASYFIYNKDTNTVVEYTHIYQSGDPDYCIHIVVPEYFTIDNIEYPSSYIGVDCFSSVDAVTSIEFQETVTSIGTNCFYNCPDLVSIILPKSVSEIKDSPILDCNNLESIVVDSDNVSFTSESGVLFNESKTSLIVYPSNRAGTTYLVEDNILEIKNIAFNNCNNLLFLKVSSLEPFIVYDESFINYNTNFKIKVNITKVDDYKLAWSTYSSIIIGYYVNEADFVVSGTTITLYIGTETGNLLIPSNIDDVNITGIANTTFNTNNDFSNVIIPYTITSINNNTFGECSSLSSIDVEAANTAYMSEDGILYNKAKTLLVTYPRAKSGYSFIIPNTVTSCSPYAFNNCSNLTSITNVKGFGEGTFKGTKVTVINVLTPITQFYNYAFKNCDMLTTVTYSGTITSIGIESFYGCSNMTDFSIPITTTSIGDRAFYGCTKLRVVDSYNLTPPTAGADIFDGTSQYLKITVDSDSLLAYRAAWSEYALYIYSKEPILPDFLSTTDFINIVSEQNIIDGNIIIINPDVIRTSINNTEAVFVLDNKNKNFNKLIEAEQILINKIVNKVN